MFACRWSLVFAVPISCLFIAVSVIEAADDRRLVEATKRHDIEVTHALLVERVDVNVAEIDGTTALHWAVHHDDVDTVKRLLRAGALVNASNRYGVKPLSIACLNGSGVIAEALLEAGADQNTSQPEGETVLMTAARSGSLSVVNLLIARGADVNAKETWRGQTAVMWAAAEGHAAVVRLLANHGADIHTRSTFPELAPGRGPGRLREAPEGMTPILFAVRHGHIGAVMALLDAGADVNDTAPSGYSLLHLAILNGHFELAATLLDRSADPNAVGPLPAGLTPLHHVVQVRRPVWRTRPQPVPTGNLGSLQLIGALIEHGAEVDGLLPAPPEATLSLTRTEGERIPPPGGGATPLWLAARGPDPEAMRLLISFGANPLVETDDQVTLLMSAAGIDYRQGPREKLESEVLEAVQIALELGGNVSATAVDGSTALHGASIRGVNSTVRLLLERGAKIDAKNNRGRIPLDIAEDASDMRAQPETAALLRKLMSDRVGVQ